MREFLSRAGTRCAEEALLRREDSAEPNPKGAQASARRREEIEVVSCCFSERDKMVYEEVIQ